MTTSEQALPAPRPLAERLRESWAYLKWFYWPPGRMSARDIYELVKTNSFSGKGLYLNLGYWKEARHIDDACEAMALLLAETANLRAGDAVVDVGFGYAEQDMLWVRHFDVARIVGLNIAPSQVALARERVAAQGLADRIDLREGSATEMPLPDATFDKVVGLECAFHFDSREKFFGEAHRVLRPGGRLALVDVVPNKPAATAFARASQRMGWNFFARKYSVPEANFDSHEQYTAKLRAQGFTNVRITSIREHVYEGLHRFMASDREMLQRFHPLARFPYAMTLKMSAERVYMAYDYIAVQADKPAAPAAATA